MVIRLEDRAKLLDDGLEARGKLLEGARTAQDKDLADRSAEGSKRVDEMRSAHAEQKSFLSGPFETSGTIAAANRKAANEKRSLARAMAVALEARKKPVNQGEMDDAVAEAVIEAVNKAKTELLKDPALKEKITTIYEGTLSDAFPGYGSVRGKWYYDADIVTDTVITTTGTAITDASTAKAKTWIKISFSGTVVTVSFQNGPPSYVGGKVPDNEIWMRTAELLAPFYFPGF